MNRRRVLGDISLCVFAAISLIALGLALEHSGVTAFCFYLAAGLAITPLVRVLVIRSLRAWSEP